MPTSDADHETFENLSLHEWRPYVGEIGTKVASIIMKP